MFLIFFWLVLVEAVYFQICLHNLWLHKTLCGLHKSLNDAFPLSDFDSIFILCWNVPGGGRAHLLAHAVTWWGSRFLIWYGIICSTGSAAFFTPSLRDIHPLPQWECSRFRHVSPPPIRQYVEGTKGAIWLSLQRPGWGVLVSGESCFVCGGALESALRLCVANAC